MFIAVIALAAGLSAPSLPQRPSAAGLLPPRPAAHRLITDGKAKALATGTAVPINAPGQFAVDGQGNLYVANAGAGDVLIYNSSFVQQTARTISTGMFDTAGVAVDPYGNVFICNPYYNVVNEYNSSGQLLKTYATGLQTPTSLAVDSLDDVYVVNNDFTSLSIFLKDGAVAAYAPRLPPAYHIASVALSGSDLILATSSNNVSTAGDPAGSSAVAIGFDADSVVQGSDNREFVASLVPNDLFAYGAAADSSGGLWFCDYTHRTIEHTIFNGNNPVATVLNNLPLNYAPTGIAVDSVHGYVYVSDAGANLIHVYNATTGALIKHIH